MRFLFLCLVVCSLFADAKNKEYIQFGDVKVTWSAYKTPLKEPVSGTFTQMVYTPATKNATTLSGLFKGSNIEIHAMSPNTGNKSRDETLREAFFSKLHPTIKAEVLSLIPAKDGEENGIIEIKLSLNNITQIVPLRYHYKQNLFEAYGTIDIFDFDGSGALESINQACYALHEGKTWNDIDIHFSAIVAHMHP